MKLIQILCCSLFLPIALNVNAGLIDFETTASGGVPTDNGIIEFTDAFIADGVTVRFGFDSDFDGVLDTKAVFEGAAYSGEVEHSFRRKMNTLQLLSIG